MNSSNGSNSAKSETLLITRKEQDSTKGSFIAIPRFWVDEFFGPNTIYTFPDGSKKKGTRVPASFWKFTLHLWRWVSLPRTLAGKVTFHTDIAMDQFPVRSDAAILWTAAYAVSGVIDVQMGRWTKEHDQPTVFIYKPETTHAAWRCFLNGLDYAYNLMSDTKRIQRMDKRGIGSNVGGWKVLVAREVDAARKRAGLPSINGKFLTDALTLKDAQGRHIAYQDDDQVIQPYFHPVIRRQKPDESDDNLARRLTYESYDREARGF